MVGVLGVDIEPQKKGIHKHLGLKKFLNVIIFSNPLGRENITSYD